LAQATSRALGLKPSLQLRQKLTRLFVVLVDNVINVENIINVTQSAATVVLKRDRRTACNRFNRVVAIVVASRMAHWIVGLGCLQGSRFLGPLSRDAQKVCFAIGALSSEF
jgi:hypothetical protein